MILGSLACLKWEPTALNCHFDETSESVARAAALSGQHEGLEESMDSGSYRVHVALTNTKEVLGNSLEELPRRDAIHLLNCLLQPGS